MTNDKKPIIIAGPCSAESPEQLMRTAEALADMGVSIFRAGVWKPRTKPGGFEGVGEIALDWLDDVKEATGLKYAIEVANGVQMNCAALHDIDAIWIGARTTANPFAVQEIADRLMWLKKDLPKDFKVYIKNPVSHDVELWAGAVQRIKNAGIENIGLIHRGFTPCGYSQYRNTPSWSVAVEMHRRFPELELICDPSHMAGKRELIPDLAQTALNIGFDGLMIESHCDPDNAKSDSAQQFTPDALKDLLDNLNLRSESNADCLDSLREDIDSIDTQIIELLARRMDVSARIGESKSKHDIPIVQPERCNEVIESRYTIGKRCGLSESFMRSIYGLIHDESVRHQIFQCSQ